MGRLTSALPAVPTDSGIANFHLGVSLEPHDTERGYPRRKIAQPESGDVSGEVDLSPNSEATALPAWMMEPQKGILLQ